MNAQHSGNPEPSDRCVPQPCHKLPEAAARVLLDHLPIGIVVVHRPTMAVYANPRGAQLLERIQPDSHLLEAGGPSAKLRTLLEAVATPNTVQRVTMQFPDERAPSFCKAIRILPEKGPPGSEEWDVLCIERDDCQNLLECPVMRLWLPMLLGKPANNNG